MTGNKCFLMTNICYSCLLAWCRNTQAHVKSVMYNHSPVHIGKLCKALENYSWTGLLLAIEHKTVHVNTAFAEFNAIALNSANYFVEKYIPSRTVCIMPKDPAFITPAIKYYLRKRNIVMRKGFPGTWFLCLVILLKLIIRQFWLNLRLVSPVSYQNSCYSCLLAWCRNTQAHVKSVMYNHSPVHTGKLCKALENYSWTGLLLAIKHKTVDVQKQYRHPQFYAQ